MEADDHAVEEVLSEGRRFMVPLYQRQYQWHEPQLKAFWEDVEAKAVENLEDTSKFDHYMGALILSPVGEAAQIGVTPKVQIVDGQQRLTTFLLFLAAIREVARKRDCLEVVNHVKDYLFNKLKSKDKPNAKYKLTPNPTDRTVFHDILEGTYDSIRDQYHSKYWGGRVPMNTQMKALRAYDEFYRLIDQFAQFGSTELNLDEDQDTGGDATMITDESDTVEAIEGRLESLLVALLNRMKLVVIILGENDDAQVIFETLNSKGEPLLAMDLVRNNIFYRLEQEHDHEDVEGLYNKFWDPFDQPWWKELAPSARPRRLRIDHFLTHVLVAETGQKISMRELYAEYRSFAVPKGKPRFEQVEEELKVLSTYSPIYETLEGRMFERCVGEDKDLFWLGRKLAAWQVTTAYPIAMQIRLCNNIERDEKLALYKLIYSYIVRRALAGLTSKSLNKVFQSIAQFFLQNCPSIRAFSNYFTDRTGDSNRFPTDDELRSGILSKPAYILAPQNRIKDILWEFEYALRKQNKFAEQLALPADLWTEHVLPRSWTEEWPFEDGQFVGRETEDPKATRRNSILETLGNLTLLKSTLDISISNKSFNEKRKKFKEHSKLFLNDWFLTKERWDERDIHERGEVLANTAIRIWPSLDSM